jgi:hypothetical protein
MKIFTNEFQETIDMCIKMHISEDLNAEEVAKQLGDKISTIMIGQKGHVALIVFAKAIEALIKTMEELE